MMTWATWLAVLVLGPGAIGIFSWFLFDLRALFRRTEDGGGE